MWGVTIAFKKYSPFLGYWGSPWVGLKYFRMFFESKDAFRIIRNTFLLSFYSLLFGFPAPIILALILNEVRNSRFKKLVQTITYMPHFISTVVVVSMLFMFLSPTTGIINRVLESLGMEKINFMGSSEWFRPIYVISGIWQGVGWGSIIYLAAISKVDIQLYDSAVIDGANKFRQILHITIPCIVPTIISLLILNMGRILSVGFEKVFLMQSPIIYETSDVIQTFVYRQGLQNANFSYATAIGLFENIIGLVFVVSTNFIAKRVGETSLW
jgi:putative aldouronate transport system permease protein